MNDPIMYTDPSGGFPICALIIGGLIGAIIGSASSIISQGIETKWDWNKIDGNLIISSAIFGAIDGMFSVLGLSTPASFLLDIGLSFAESIASAAIQGTEYTVVDFMIDTGLTLASFGISSLVSVGANRMFKDSFDIDIDAKSLEGKWLSAERILQSNQGIDRKMRAISKKKYVKNTIAMGISYYVTSGLLNGVFGGLLSLIK